MYCAAPCAVSAKSPSMRNAKPRRCDVNVCDSVLDVIKRYTPSCGTILGSVWLNTNVLYVKWIWSVKSHRSKMSVYTSLSARIKPSIFVAKLWVSYFFYNNNDDDADTTFYYYCYFF